MPIDLLLRFPRQDLSFLGTQRYLRSDFKRKEEARSGKESWASLFLALKQKEVNTLIRDSGAFQSSSYS